MKHLIAIIAALLMVQMANAQVKLGLRAGLSSTDITTDQIIIKDAHDLDALGISVANANYGIHLGAVMQIQIRKFFLQPEILLNTSSIDYRVEDLKETQIFENIARESYQYMDLPIMMGFKFGPLRLQGGPVGHKFLNSNSDLTDISGYDPKFKDWTWGYQTGIGLDIWKIMIDVKYEGSFNKQSDHFQFFGNQYAFDKNPGRFVATLGYTF
jgi:Outer membrane protein beta-barrel domain